MMTEAQMRATDLPYREAVALELERRGFVCYPNQYPGALSISLRNGYEVWTGMHGWEYGSWSEDVGHASGMMEPVFPDKESALADIEVRFMADAPEVEAGTAEPEVTAAVWADICETVEGMCDACFNPRESDPDFCPECLADMARKREEQA